MFKDGVLWVLVGGAALVTYAVSESGDSHLQWPVHFAAMTLLGLSTFVRGFSCDLIGCKRCFGF